MTPAECRQYVELRSRLRALTAKSETLCSSCLSGSGVVVAEQQKLRESLLHELIDLSKWLGLYGVHTSQGG